MIDDDEFVLLYEGNFSKNPEFPYEEYEMFYLYAMDDMECKVEFRFRKNEIPRLAEALDIPENFFLPPRHNNSWNRRTLCAFKATDLPLFLLWFNTSFRATNTRAEHDLQHCFGSHLQHTRSQNKPVEQSNLRSCESGEVCGSYPWQRCSTG